MSKETYVEVPITVWLSDGTRRQSTELRPAHLAHRADWASLPPPGVVVNHPWPRIGWRRRVVWPRFHRLIEWLDHVTEPND